MTRCCVSHGCCRYFQSLFNPPRSSETPGFFSYIETQTQSHCPRNVGRAEQLSPSSQHATYEGFMTRTESYGAPSTHYRPGKYFLLPVLWEPWALPLYWAQEPAGRDKSTSIPIFHLLTLWQPHAIHSNVLCA